MKRLIMFLIVFAFFSNILYSQTFTSLHDFSGVPSDGSSPFLNGPLIIGSTIFACTNNGGSTNSGVIYKIKIDGTGYILLHDFLVTEGIRPACSLICIGDTLYGTLSSGGSHNGGTIFKLDTNGSGFAVIHNFDPSLEPSNPYGTLLRIGLKLFGTGSVQNGYHGGIFYFDLSDNTIHTLKSFNLSDGDQPHGDLICVGSTIFGTAILGGSTGDGTIFRIDTSGANFSIIHDFTISANGQRPAGGLIFQNDRLYGATLIGGSNSTGTIYRLDTNGGNFQVLHDFTDLLLPDCSLTFVNGMIFGTSTFGSISNSGGIFKIDTNGANYSLLYSFGTLGSGSQSNLVLHNDILYGARQGGGLSNLGQIFSFSISPPTITTSAITGIAGTTATGNGNVIDTGLTVVVTRGFVWNTSGTPTIADNVVNESGSYGNGAFSQSLTGLTPETLYHVRAYAINDMGISYGNEVTFTTIPIPAWALGLMALGLVGIGVIVLYRKMII